MNDILANIRTLREKKRLSQEYIADCMGITQASYALIESGKRELKYRQLEQIAIALNENVIDIITFPDRYEKKTNLTTKRRVMIEVELDEEEYADFIRTKIK